MRCLQMIYPRVLRRDICITVLAPTPLTPIQSGQATNMSANSEIIPSMGKAPTHMHLATNTLVNSEMATGTGKTITALSATTRLLDFIRKKNSKLVIVVTVPFLHLGEQWCEEAVEFGFDPIRCYDGTGKWLSGLQASYNQLLTGEREYLLAVAVNASFANA